MQTVTGSIQKGDQVSVLLMDLLKKPIKLNPLNPYLSLCQVLGILKLTSNLGWVEHESNWDIGSIIYRKDGSKIEVPQGYGDCLMLTLIGEPLTNAYLSVNETKNIFLELREYDTDIDDEDVHPIQINIWDIDSISFFS